MFKTTPFRASLSALLALGGLGLQIQCVKTGYTLPPSTPPVIQTQPADITVNAPAPATFTVTASASPTPTYSWAVNNVLIPGATGSSYTTPATTLAMDGSTYSVQVWNGTADNAIWSRQAVLTVNSAPVITTQPLGAAVAAGATATFTVAATGKPAPTYQWYLGGVAIPGATSDFYTTPAATQAMNGGSYTVTATNAVGTVTSSAVILAVN